MIRRIEIEADDVANFLDKLRVRRELERVNAMGLQPEGLPDSRDRRLRERHRSAMERVLHWVACDGGPSRVRVMRSTTISSVTVRGAPGRGSSTSPSRRRTQKRSRHLPTLLLDTCRRAATVPFGRPSAHANT